MTITIGDKEYTAKLPFTLGMKIQVEGIAGKMKALSEKLGLNPPAPQMPELKIPEGATDEERERITTAWDEKFVQAYQDPAYQEKRDKYFLKATPDDDQAHAALDKLWVRYCGIFLEGDVSELALSKLGDGEDKTLQNFFDSVRVLTRKSTPNGQNSESDGPSKTGLDQN